MIPAAVGAVAPLVNFPNGCDPELLDDQYRTVTKAEITGDAKKKALLRVRFTKSKFEKVWAQGDAGAPMVNWSDVFPELVSGGPVPACEVPIIRVVRFDESGTSFAFKDYLSTIEPARGWTAKYATEDTTALTRKWPGAEFGSGGQCGGTSGRRQAGRRHRPSDQRLRQRQRPADRETGRTDGSVGYSDISTAGSTARPSRSTRAGQGADDAYWTQVENGSNVFAEPTASPNGFRTDGAKGANCKATEFTNVPGAPRSAIGRPRAGSTRQVGFGICTLTYGLVFDDNAAVWGDSAGRGGEGQDGQGLLDEHRRPGSQSGLFAATTRRCRPTSSRSPKPASIRSAGKAGPANRRHPRNSHRRKPTAKKTHPSSRRPATRSRCCARRSRPKPVARPSRSSSPGAGQARGHVGTAKNGKKTVKVGRVVLNASKAGTFELTLNPSAAAKQLLKEKGSLKVNL